MNPFLARRRLFGLTAALALFAATPAFADTSAPLRVILPIGAGSGVDVIVRSAQGALSKALGTGFRAGVFWRDIGVVNLPGGKPTLALTGGAAARLAAITPPGMRAVIDITLTDEPPLAQAVVIITALPAG